jgi:hypothetical protein
MASIETEQSAADNEAPIDDDEVEVSDMDTVGSEEVFDDDEPEDEE